MTDRVNNLMQGPRPRHSGFRCERCGGDRYPEDPDVAGHPCECPLPDTGPDEDVPLYADLVIPF